MLHVRQAAVAGLFYPSAPAELLHQVDSMLEAARPPLRKVPKALIVPHAGYIYSGPIAATGYALLQPAEQTIRRVVLLGPSHRVYLRGVALPDADAFETPLGSVAIDKSADLADLPHHAAAHSKEHSLEVQIPFLQRIVQRFSLVPLAVGDASGEEVAQIIDALWGESETLILISSDLSHYLPYEVAKSMDEQTVKMILNLGPTPIDHERACGASPINGLLVAARRRKLRPVLLDLRNSGDTAGARSGVVGYTSIAFYEDGETAHVE